MDTWLAPHLTAKSGTSLNQLATHGAKGPQHCQSFTNLGIAMCGENGVWSEGKAEWSGGPKYGPMWSILLN